MDSYSSTPKKSPAISGIPLSKSKSVSLLNSPSKVYPEKGKVRRAPSMMKKSTTDSIKDSSGKGSVKKALSSILTSMTGKFSPSHSPPPIDKRYLISQPYNARHITHVGFDKDTGEFMGLPMEWRNMLTASGISKTEQAANPQVFHFILLD